MVDALKGNSSVLRSAATVSGKTLRENFKSLSSVKVSETAVRGEPVAPRSENTANAEKVSSVLSGLNEAVSHSAMALDSIKKVADAGSALTDTTALSSVLKDLEGIGNSVTEVLNVLRERLDHAEVVSENISASTARLSDLDAAQAQAAQTESQIQFNSQTAVEAHTGLTPDRVARLLVE